MNSIRNIIDRYFFQPNGQLSDAGVKVVVKGGLGVLTASVGCLAYLFFRQQPDPAGNNGHEMHQQGYLNNRAVSCGQRL